MRKFLILALLFGSVSASASDSVFITATGVQVSIDEALEEAIQDKPVYECREVVATKKRTRSGVSLKLTVKKKVK